MDWNSDLYLEFAEERKQPCIDLLSRLGGEYKKILDLGCGPGNSTENLLIKYHTATVIGFDSDDNMLEKAKKIHPDVEFIKGYAPTDFCKLSGKFDLVFSNACIHWIENQENLINEVYKILNKNGVFAVQIPLTDKSQFYKILHMLIERKWTILKGVNSFHSMTPQEYYNTLTKRFAKVTMWQSNYYHIASKELIIEWYKGSGLRPYLDLLSENEKEEFINDLQEIINNEYSLLDDGNVFLIMLRLFFIAER